MAVKKYKDQGYSEEEANIKATYDAMLKEQGDRLAKYNLDRQIAELKKNGYQFSDAWNTNNILNKPISKWTDGNKDIWRRCGITIRKRQQLSNKSG